MRVVFDVSNLFTCRGGGIYNYLLRLIPALKRTMRSEKLSLDFFQLYFRSTISKEHRLLADSPITRFRFPVRLLNHLWLRFNWPDLAKKLGNPEIFHSPHFSLPVISGAKRILTVNDIIYLKHPEYYQTGGKKINEYGYKFLLPENCRRADLIIAISEYTRQDLLEYFQLPEDKVVTVHFGADHPAIMPEPDLVRILKKFGLLPGTYIYFPVGTYEPRKNIPATLKAFNAANKNNRYKLVMSGVGDQTWLDNGPGRENITVVRWDDDAEKNALYQGSLFVAYPSLYEGFGIPVVEAMGNGRAVLTANTTSIREIAAGHAYTVNPADEDEMMAGMAALIENESLRNEFEKKSLARSKDFSWDKMAAEYVKIYRKLGEGHQCC